MAWTPGEHRARLALEVPYEDVPAHLVGPLWAWIDWNLRHTVDPAQVAIDLRRPLASGLQTYQQVDKFKSWVAGEGGASFMLDLVETLLEMSGGYNAEDLDLLLETANSAYKVRGDNHGLTMRVTGGVQEMVVEAIESAVGSAGTHLTSAWNAAYGRQHDAVKSYSEAIKAVEAALAPQVSPQNGRQTLGTMIKDVAAKPSKWKFEIADGRVEGVATVLHMMTILWDGQTSRHGAVSATRHETIEEARAAVHLAAALVQFGSSGAFAGI